MTTENNELGKYDGAGFMFVYSNGRIGTSKDILKDEIEKIDEEKMGDDETPLFVYCKKCAVFMTYHRGWVRPLTGFWLCPICGAKVREKTVYTHLDNENSEYNEINEFDDNDIPEGCEACGGPYPDCMASCPIFDDE